LKKIIKSKITIRDYLPLFFLLCLSGNPLFTQQDFSKHILVIYFLTFGFYILLSKSLQLDKRARVYLFGLILSILVISFAQDMKLGFVSYPSVIAIIIKILLALLTILYYKNKKIDLLDIYVKLLAWLVILSLPFFLISQYREFGLLTNNINIKSIGIYTFISYDPNYDFTYGIIRNPGMFWEAGAFAGYLLLALVFVAIQNKKFTIVNYKKEVFWIILGVITTMSTTGFLVLSVIIIFFAMEHFNKGKLLFIPASIITVIFIYSNFTFMQNKIEAQYEQALNLRLGDLSNSRFGSLIMDAYYIKEEPIIGNGTYIDTRFRFNPEVTGSIGNGNGMSNFMACWGIPLFMYWLVCVFYFSIKATRNKHLSFIIPLIILLILQGEQFLDYPIFLMFFTLPYTNFINKRYS
jgi:flagellar biosynthesis protein FliQ